MFIFSFEIETNHYDYDITGFESLSLRHELNAMFSIFYARFRLAFSIPITPFFTSLLDTINHGGEYYVKHFVKKKTPESGETTGVQRYRDFFKEKKL